MIKSIITNNCYGSQYYQDKKTEYKTPFVGLFLFSPCYINFLENYNDYINEEITKVNRSKYCEHNYPVGEIGSSEIHFLHYKTFSEANEKWNRRKKRLNPFNECFLKMCDRDLFNENILDRFLSLDHPQKILFLSKKYQADQNSRSCRIIKTKYENECDQGLALYHDYPITSFI
jgi:uncharacterized protein (DUF1919 family)